QNYKELFTLFHAQARNVIEQIFERRFLVFSRGPEYSVDTQTRLVSAVSILHNFIWTYAYTVE
ncbi:hypothetical protein L218DRAFT_883839, partial [Marasmius fiardii PR-910]